jgi:hypothetical protein
MLWGFDFLIFAGILAAGASLLTIRSVLGPPSPELSASFYGKNLFQFRNQIRMRYEAIAGTIWMSLSLAAMSAGTILMSIGQPKIVLRESLIHILLLLAVGSVCFWITTLITNCISRKVYIPEIIESYRGLYDRCVALLSEAGRLDLVTQELDKIGTLIDRPRNKNEDNDTYLRRLRPHFYEN